MIDIVLADDHAIVCDGLRALIERQSDLRVVAIARDGWEAIRLTEDFAPAVLVMDIAMPNLNGIEAANRITARPGAPRIVIHSMHATNEHVHRAFEAGALGYLLKESAGWELLDAIGTVVRGKRYVSFNLREQVRDLLASDGPVTSRLASLSARERDVLQLVVEGNSSAKVAELLHLSPNTVDTYRSRVMHKLGVGDITGLVRFAIQHGITVLR
jgi:DNA-binding NarL/FixJ family response regulator